MNFSLEFILLFVVATAVAILARRFKFPYTVGLVIAGLMLGAASAFPVPHLTQDLLYAVFLPGLLFEAAFHLNFGRFWENKIAISAMAVPGLLVAVLVTALILISEASTIPFIRDFGFVHALVFSALIAATDPIAVVGLFKNLGAPKRMTTLVEGESLLNDGTAVVIFTLVVGIAAGETLGLGGAVVTFVRTVGLGLAVGVIVGLGISTALQRIDDPMVEITLTVIAAYGSFVAAEQLHASGVIATVSVGMMCGNYGARTGMRPSTRIAVETFWEYLAFALNSVVFLLIGFEVTIESLVASWVPILAAYLAVMVGRLLVVFAVGAVLRRSRERLPWGWCTVLWWAGLRGGLSMVLVLGLALDFPFRETLLHMTFGVVLLSILGQGLSMAPLLRRLGLVPVWVERHPYEVERGRLLAARAALLEIEQLGHDAPTHGDVLDRLRATYQDKVRASRKTIAGLHASMDAFRHEEERTARRRLLKVEKDAALKAYHQGVIGEEALAEVMGDIDARLMELTEDSNAPQVPSKARN